MSGYEKPPIGDVAAGDPLAIPPAEPAVAATAADAEMPDLATLPAIPQVLTGPDNQIWTHHGCNWYYQDGDFDWWYVIINEQYCRRDAESGACWEYWDGEGWKQSVSTPQTSVAQGTLATTPLYSSTYPQVRILEVGAGGGEFTALLFQDHPELVQCLAASDIEVLDGPRGTLRALVGTQIPRIGGLDANKLHEYFTWDSLDMIISANCYGESWRNPSLSYGLRKYTGRWNARAGTGQMEIDDRFLCSAFKVLRPGGVVAFVARSNLLFLKNEDDKKSNRTAIYTSGYLKKLNKLACRVNQQKLPTTNAFALVYPSELLELAQRLPASITVSPIIPPKGLVNTGHADKRGSETLCGFNVQITFKKIKKTNLSDCGVTYLCPESLDKCKGFWLSPTDLVNPDVHERGAQGQVLRVSTSETQVASSSSDVQGQVLQSSSETKTVESKRKASPPIDSDGRDTKKRKS